MKKGDAVYYIETNNKIKEATIVSVNGEFITLRYGTTDPHYINGGKHHLEATGGIRLRKSRLFPSKEKAEEFIKKNNAAMEKAKKAAELNSVFNQFN